MTRLISVLMENYKSVESSNLELDKKLTILVGPNASGKSNIIDALSFISDAVSTSLDQAFQRRYGVSSVRRETRHGSCDISFDIKAELSEGKKADYHFIIDTGRSSEFFVKEESCRVYSFLQMHEYKIKDGQFEVPIKGISPKLEKDRLALQSVSALSEYRELYDLLSGIRVYTLNTNIIRNWQERSTDEKLSRDGSNAAFIIGKLAKENPQAYDRLCNMLKEFIPSITKVSRSQSVAQKDTIQFEQLVPKYKDPLKFYAHNMSEGTLRLLGILLAFADLQNKPTVIGIEEPELTVHPAMISKLMEYLIEESSDVQIIITTHSPDVLDSQINPNQLRIISLNQEMLSEIRTINDKELDLLNRKTLTMGDLLKSGELEVTQSKLMEF